MKCAIYARVSTESDNQKTSIPNQISIAETEVNRQGWDVYKVYTDTQSGTTTNRPGLQSLLKDIKQKKFDVVIAKNFSRISRDGEFSYKFKKIVQENNIDLLTLDGAVNTFKGESNIFGAHVWQSENYVMQISSDIKKALKAIHESGKFTFAPYGYTLQNGTLIISENGQAEIVQQIFKDYISGKSFDAIARSLFEKNVPTPANAKGKENANIYWHGSTVRQILEREVYTGSLVYNKSSTISPVTKKRIKHDKKDWIIIKDTHEPIIKREDFELVQQLIQSRKRIRSQQGSHLFTGFLTCGSCGAGMHFKRDRYVCGKQNKHCKKACPENYRPIEKNLAQAILNDINSIYFSNMTNAFVEAAINKQVKFHSNFDKELKKYQNEISKLLLKKEKALDKLLEDKIEQEDYDNLLSKLNLQLQQHKLELKLLQENSSEGNIDYSQLTTPLLEQLTSDSLLKTLTAETLARFIKKIIVKKDGQLEVHYRTSRPFFFKSKIIFVYNKNILLL